MWNTVFSYISLTEITLNHSFYIFSHLKRKRISLLQDKELCEVMRLSHFLKQTKAKIWAMYFGKPPIPSSKQYLRAYWLIVDCSWIVDKSKKSYFNTTVICKKGLQKVFHGLNVFHADKTLLVLFYGSSCLCIATNAHQKSSVQYREITQVQRFSLAEVWSRQTARNV